MSLSAEALRASLRGQNAPQKSYHTKPVSVLTEPEAEAGVSPKSVGEARESTQEASNRTEGRKAQSGQDSRGRQNLSTTPQNAPPRRQTRARAAPTRDNGAQPDIQRLPPHSVDAEKGVLSSMLQASNEVIPEVVSQAKEEWFYVPAHQAIYSQLVKMWDSGKLIDLLTFTQRMIDTGQSGSVGGPAYITEVQNFVPTAANVSYYLGIVRDKYLLRQIILGGTEAVRQAYEEQDDVDDLMDKVEQRFIGIGDTRASLTDTLISAKDAGTRAIELIEGSYERKGGLNGLATGFIELDRMTGGFHPGEMIVIAARPSMGKTALAMGIAEFVAVHEQKPVGIFSLEMSTDQLMFRMLGSRARVNLAKIRDGFLGERDFPALTAACAKIMESKMWIDDQGGITILELRAKARRLRARVRVELIVIDYLQLLRSNSKKAQDNRQIEVSEISAGIKALAKELEIPILVCAQLNRQPEARAGGKPRLSDLRESGSVEQDADVVGLLVRPEIYEEDEEARAEKAGEAELIIAKQRNGPVGEIPLIFLKEFTRFEDRARNISEPEEEPY
jgi:replicative DNA helicase